MHGDKAIGDVSDWSGSEYYDADNPKDTVFRIGQASIERPYRGQGLYQRLLMSILGHRGELQSIGQRNKYSQRSHEMLQERLKGLPGVHHEGTDDLPSEDWDDDDIVIVWDDDDINPPDLEDLTAQHHQYRLDYNWDSPDKWGSLRPQMGGELPVRTPPRDPQQSSKTHVGQSHRSTRQFDPTTGDMAILEPEDESQESYDERRQKESDRIERRAEQVMRNMTFVPGRPAIPGASDTFDVDDPVVAHELSVLRERDEALRDLEAGVRLPRQKYGKNKSVKWGGEVPAGSRVRHEHPGYATPAVGSLMGVPRGKTARPTRGISFAGQRHPIETVETGEPMDIAMRLLKAGRQTELGEYHEDFPSSHGPVTGYRALSDEQHKKISHEGLTGTPIKTHLEGIGQIRDNPPKKGIYAWMGHTPTGLDFAREQAEDWANEMTHNRDTPSRVVGIRGRHNLSHPDDYGNDFYGVHEEPDGIDHASAYIIPHDISPEQIVRMGESMDIAFQLLKHQIINKPSSGAVG